LIVDFGRCPNDLDVSPLSAEVLVHHLLELLISVSNGDCLLLVDLESLAAALE
jgi:hypothetical protein